MRGQQRRGRVAQRPGVAGEHLEHRRRPARMPVAGNDRLDGSLVRAPLRTPRVPELDRLRDLRRELLDVAAEQSKHQRERGRPADGADRVALAHVRQFVRHDHRERVLARHPLVQSACDDDVPAERRKRVRHVRIRPVHDGSHPHRQVHVPCEVVGQLLQVRPDACGVGGVRRHRDRRQDSLTDPALLDRIGHQPCQRAATEIQHRRHREHDQAQPGREPHEFGQHALSRDVDLVGDLRVFVAHRGSRGQSSLTRPAQCRTR